jgi:hypothetical protein
VSRSFLAVRRCGPLEYALRVLAEAAMLAAGLAALRWLLPLVPAGHAGHVPGLMSWPAQGRYAACAFYAAIATIDVAELRPALRRAGR